MLTFILFSPPDILRKAIQRQFKSWCQCLSPTPCIYWMRMNHRTLHGFRIERDRIQLPQKVRASKHMQRDGDVTIAVVCINGPPTRVCKNQRMIFKEPPPMRQISWKLLTQIENKQNSISQAENCEADVYERGLVAVQLPVGQRLAMLLPKSHTATSKEKMAVWAFLGARVERILAANMKCARRKPAIFINTGQALSGAVTRNALLPA